MREHPAQAALRAETDRLEHGDMRTSPEAAALIAFLIEVTDAKAVLEVGCFTGHATLAMALALPPDGLVTTLDVNANWQALGRRHWQAAGVADRIRFREGPALASLDELLAEGHTDGFDLALIDADKKTYPAYLQRCRRLVRTGGLIVLDNTLWRGRVADPGDGSRQALTLRHLNQAIHDDPDLALVLLPVGDGLTLLRRRR
ncbi:class I SAM-dependent methyltransferase [Geminicoccus flavidas]|uniref:class I SAM-dependent methyltransferase n=1 Tax=Geminicoccus flavidas TaxID=2506407 RepID=UPI0013590858|nr:class I SAM-dependent methyltransferase [Geminicoccus flavidas]